MGLSLILLTVQFVAADQITKRDGTVLTGQITGIANGQILYSSTTSSGGIVKLSCYLTDVQPPVNMATPPEVVKVQNAAPAAVVAALEPEIKQFAGLPADWVVAAMAQLAEAYNALNQSDKAVALYDQIDTLYPGSKYHAEAVAGKAAMSLQQGKIDEALAAVQPIVDQANQDIAPSPSQAALYANSFIVYGQALEAQKKNEQALEAYLTVKTMFYQNPVPAGQADQLAQKLRAQNPGLGVP